MNQCARCAKPLKEGVLCAECRKFFERLRGLQDWKFNTERRLRRESGVQ